MIGSFGKKIIVAVLRVPVRVFLMRVRPEVIAVTGSAGKTTTKEFIASILESEYEVLSPLEGYNTEIGAPLALFGEKVPKNLFAPFAWIVIIARIYIKSIFSKNNPEKVVVEMGADSPGDIKYLAGLFKPNKAVVLTVLPVHLAEFGTIQKVAEEKSELVKVVGRDGTVFLNFDDVQVRDMAKEAKARVVFFGTSGNANIVAKSVKSDLMGISFTLDAEGHTEKFSAPILGQQMIYPLLAAISVGLSENISVSKIKERVKRLAPFKGRMNPIEGKNGSIIIDDSYNANPKSTVEALDFISRAKGRRIGVLGNMNELGSYEREGHELVGRKAAKSLDMLVTVGDVAQKYIAEEAKKDGLEEGQVKSFETSPEAGAYLAGVLKKGDVLLVKGSQNRVRLEMAVEKIMAHPEEKEKQLVRQSAFWKE